MNLLSVDIGNTSISFGISKPNRIINTFYIPTSEYSFYRLKQRLKGIFIDDAVICSVVPCQTNKLKKDIKRLSGKDPYIIGKDIRVPIKNLYRDPKQVEEDRLVNAYAALRLYGLPVIAVDFGTAVTFDVISKKGEYLGGMILPGLKISLEALNKRTALLPKVDLKKPDGFIGRDTENSMLSGIVYGFSSLTDNLVMRIKKLIGNARVIATGGNSKFIGRYCASLDAVDTNLTLKGLAMLYCYKKNT